jgi:predicted metal-dependent peptidase
MKDIGITNFDALEAIKRQRMALLLDEPFFGALLLGMDLVESTETPVMATNGEYIRFNPEAVLKMDGPEIKTVLAHEVLHVALLHPFRIGTRDPKKANRAADYAINNHLDQMNRKKPGLAPPFPWPKAFPPLINHDWDELSFEEIYPKLPDDDGEGCGGGGPGDVIPVTGDPADVAEAEAKMKVAVHQAMLAAKAQGKLPASLERQIKDEMDPEVPWSELLKSFVRDLSQDDYSWRHPNRSFLASADIILPSLRSETLGPIVVWVDTSGSIGDDLLRRFLGEINAIHHDCRPSETIIMDVDARVNSVQRFPRGEDVTPTFRGGGGTDFCPAFAEVENLALEPCCGIYLTDMFGSFPSEPPAYPVLWASYEGVDSAPFGDVILVK